jgi:hypothetical protein
VIPDHPVAALPVLIDDPCQRIIPAATWPVLIEAAPVFSQEDAPVIFPLSEGDKRETGSTICVSITIVGKEGGCVYPQVSPHPSNVIRGQGDFGAATLPKAAQTPVAFKTEGAIRLNFLAKVLYSFMPHYQSPVLLLHPVNSLHNLQDRTGSSKGISQIRNPNIEILNKPE